MSYVKLFMPLRATLRLTCALILSSLLPIFAIGDTFNMTPEQYWRGPFGTEQRMPLAGDADGDGDGHADLLSLWPTGDGVIDIARTSPLGKATVGTQALTHFGRDGLAAACGPFVRNAPAADFLAVFADGSIRVAWGMALGTSQYQHDDLAGHIPAGFIPKAPVRTAVADFDNDGRADVLLLDQTGSLLLLRNEKGADGKPRFTAHLLVSKLQGVIAGNPRGQCVWLDSSGSAFKALVGVAPDGAAHLGPATLLMKVSPDEHMVVGRFRGAKEADILIGRQLLTGGNPRSIQTLSNLPSLELAKGDGPWVAADVDGNGKDDLVRYRRSADRFGSQDTYVHFSYDSNDTDKGYYCSANDGLPDTWKLGKVKPGGLDLAELGCRVGHRDIILELERFDNVSEAELRANMDRVVKYFASLPIQNPDGTTGIAFHIIYQRPWPIGKHDEVMGHFNDLFPRPEHRGIVHSAFAENNGPLVSNGLGDPSHFNGHWPEFLHEFGHQLDLRHDGWWPPTTPGFPSMTTCALYPRLMSYTYSYSRNDDTNDIGYSDGARVSFHVDELHLSKHLPFPIETVKFLSGGPYHFKIKPDPNGHGTLVDWNWDGLFDENDVEADINYSHRVDFGPRYDVGKAQTAPVLVAQGDDPKPRILMLYGKSSPDATHLVLRTWLGANRDTEGGHWSDEISVDDTDLIGDPTACYLDGVTWVAYPTVQGSVVRPITFDSDGKPHAGTSTAMPDSAHTEPTVAAFDGHLVLLLWRGSSVPVGMRTLLTDKANLTIQQEVGLDVKSTVPVGAVAGLNKDRRASLWIARTSADGSANKGRTELIRYTFDPDQNIRIAERQWVAGTYAKHRITMLWRQEPGLLPQGRLYLFSGGTNGGKPWAEQYMTINVPYPDVGGWLPRRYCQPDFASVSAPGACYYDGNIVYAVRLYNGNQDQNDTLGVGFYGNGATPTPMGDFNDYTHIRDYSLCRSTKELAN